MPDRQPLPQACGKAVQPLVIKNRDILGPTRMCILLLQKRVGADRSRVSIHWLFIEYPTEQFIRVARRHPTCSEFLRVEVSHIPSDNGCGRALYCRRCNMPVFGIGLRKQCNEMPIIAYFCVGQRFVHFIDRSAEALDGQPRSIANEGIAPFSFDLFRPAERDKTFGRKHHQHVAVMLGVKDVRIDEGGVRRRVPAGSQRRPCPPQVPSAQPSAYLLAS